MKTSLFYPLQPRTSWLMLVADGGWGMLPITMYARAKWLTKLAVFTYPHGEQSVCDVYYCQFCNGAIKDKICNATILSIGIYDFACNEHKR